MNAALGIGLNVVAWAYPPLQAPVRLYQNLQTARTVISVVSGICTGGTTALIDGIYAVATSSRSQCEAMRQVCLMNAGSDFWRQTVCEQAYQRCISALT